MPIDRIAALRNAEKLLRQGKLDQAIAEYARVVAEEPHDWNTANLIGDLYVRAGKIDQAVDQFIQIADGLLEEGFKPKAAALYKKIIKLKPDHERALLQAAELVRGQGLYADARSYLNTVVELRRARGDARGVAHAKIRIGGLDPDDYDARRAAARVKQEIGDAAGAINDLKDMAAELTEKGRPEEAIALLKAAGDIDPEDFEVREKLFDVHLETGDHGSALEHAVSGDQFKTVAARLEAAGQIDESLSALKQAAALDPADSALRAHLAKTFVGSGDLTAAAEYLTRETAGKDPQLLMTVVEIDLRRGEIESGLAVARQLITEDPARRQDLAALAWSLAEQAPDAGFQLVELAADSAIARADWPSAAAALQEFVTRMPNHIPALMRLVEVCVDGGLEATMFSAQAQLADAYIAAGLAAEARFISEDLVAREPWDRANVERFRRALELMGEPDPDAVIAERLSGESPFTSTDLSYGEFPPVPEPPPAPVEEELPELSVVSLDDDFGPQPTTRRDPESRHFQLSANAIDVGSILGALDEPAPIVSGHTDSVEVDLSIVLDDIKVPAEAVAEAEGEPQDLDGVFAGLREEATHNAPPDPAEAAYRQGADLHAAGQIDEAILELEKAAKAPRYRFAAGSLLGRIYLERNMTPQAIDWFERAAEAPAPTQEEGSRLMYDLAASLESIGEVARALAIFMELQAEVGSYRDVSKRIGRLTKAQARG